MTKNLTMINLYTDIGMIVWLLVWYISMTHYCYHEFTYHELSSKVQGYVHAVDLAWCQWHVEQINQCCRSVCTQIYSNSTSWIFCRCYNVPIVLVRYKPDTTPSGRTNNEWQKNRHKSILKMHNLMLLFFGCFWLFLLVFLHRTFRERVNINNEQE